MAAGNLPIYVTVPKAPHVSITAANAKSDGAGTIATDMFLLYTAGSNGGWVGRIRFVPSASVAATATAATVCRAYVSTQSSGATTNANTFRIDEVAVASVSADQTVTQTQFFEIPVNSFITAGESLLVSTHVANNGSTALHALLMNSGDY